MGVPKGFKKTEVGIIPVDWNSIQLKELVKLKSGFAFSSQFFSNTGPVLLTPGNFKLEGGLYFNERNTKRFSGEYNTSMQFKYGDLLLVMTDLTPDCNLLGKPAFININETILHNQRIGTIELLRKDLSKQYLYWIFLSNIYLRRIKETATGSTVRHTSNGSIYGTYIPLPPTKAEQTAIADALNDADALIIKLEKLIAKKKAIKQGAMQELLKPKEGWEEKNLGEAATLKARIGWQGLTTAEYRNSGEHFLITGTEFKNGFIDWENCHYVEEERYKQDKNIQVKEHDVLVTKDGTIGKVALIKSLPKPATLNSGVFVIRPINNSFYPEFFYYLMLSEVFIKFLSQLSAGSTINHLYQKDFVTFKFLTPVTINEQEQIAQIFSDMDAEIDVLEKKLDKYKKIKQGMMQNLLNGKVRLV